MVVWHGEAMVVAWLPASCWHGMVGVAVGSYSAVALGCYGAPSGVEQWCEH